MNVTGKFSESPHQVLERIFGFSGFRPGQETVIKTLLSGKNVLVVMPTGSGKSLCFQVPALIKSGFTVVVSPLIALMQDQVAALRLYGVAADAINSANSENENVAAWRRVVSGECRILYMAPERLMTERMLAALARLPVSMFVIDEAHCISQWGPAFRPEYEALCQLPVQFPDIPIAALTATADNVTRSDIVKRLFGGNVEQFVLGFDRPNIQLAVEIKQNWMSQLTDFVALREGESGIVYCLSRRKTEEIANLLSTKGVRALPYHAGMTKEDRELHQNIFMTDPGVVIVATIAFGMGIDKADIRYVFHTDLPGSIEAYYQEIGRAGRDGNAAVAHMLYGLSDIRTRRIFIEEEDAGPDRRRREHKRLDALLGYCEAPICRRVRLLGYFGENINSCGNCDVCLNPTERFDGTEEALKIMSAIFRSGQRFGAAHIVDILRGSSTEKIRRHDHQRLRTFGVGKSRNKSEWQSLIRQMVASGHLQLDIAGYGGLKITSKGRALLRGEGEFLYRQDTLGRPSRTTAQELKQHDIPLTDDQIKLLDSLKKLRLKIAKEKGVPAFVVFHDRTLIDMVCRCPRTTAEFSQVDGVGAAKLEQFSEPFLATINNAIRAC